MPQQEKVLVQQGTIKSCKDNLLDSIDQAIIHFQDSETQSVLKKHGFDVNSLIDDLNESKILTSRLSEQNNEYKHGWESFFREVWSLDEMSIENITNEIETYKNKGRQLTQEEINDASRKIVLGIREHIKYAIDNDANTVEQLIQPAATIAGQLSPIPELQQECYNKLNSCKQQDIENFQAHYKDSMEQKKFDYQNNQLQESYDSFLTTLKPT
ncbi:MAG: hypothetical protein QNJ51_22325 [Calothrix sp. MO_167.B12]|nr:hypothetical protein [Calothrix sp. MO_167.B12]